MGLDMYCRVKHPADQNTADGYGEEIKYWRKNNALHKWMEELYFKRKGKLKYSDADSREFNCKELELTVEDILQLQLDILAGKPQGTNGLFWGVAQYDMHMQASDLEFCGLALSYLHRKYKVYYSSWW